MEKITQLCGHSERLKPAKATKYHTLLRVLLQNHGCTYITRRLVGVIANAKSVIKQSESVSLLVAGRQGDT